MNILTLDILTPLYVHTFVEDLRELIQPPEGRPVILDSRFNHAVWFVAAQELEDKGLVLIRGVKSLGASWKREEGDPRVVVKVSWKT